MQPIFDETYKRGLTSTRVEVFPDTIRVTRGKKQVHEVRIADITRLNYYTAPSRYDYYHCFWIEAGGTRLYIQSSEHGATPDPARPFHRSVTAVLKHLVARRPDLSVGSDAGMALRWTFFLLFGMSAVMGMVFGAMVLTEAFLAGAGIFAFGLFMAPLAWGFRPWGERPGVPVAEALAVWDARVPVAGIPA